jgi:hypothetical protein
VGFLMRWLFSRTEAKIEALSPCRPEVVVLEFGLTTLLPVVAHEFRSVFAFTEGTSPSLSPFVLFTLNIASSFFLDLLVSLFFLLTYVTTME